MDGRNIFRDSIPADRLDRETLKALLTDMLAELNIGGGGTVPNGGTGTDGIAANALPYTLTGVSSGIKLNHDFNSLNVTCVAKLPGGALATGVSVNTATDENGQPDPYNVMLSCPPNWSGTVYLQLKSNSQTS